MFYDFRQNNSFGRFDYDYEAGISSIVIIEADTRAEAIDRAEEIGLYFDGTYNDGPDCPCCGDRWSRPYDDGTVEPEIYGESVATYGNDPKPWFRTKWMDEWEGFIHYKDGRKVGFWGPDGPGLETDIPKGKVIKGEAEKPKPVRKRRTTK